jgi:predicted DCC family thiol-disulfide oxidoreductase YuxK
MAPQSVPSRALTKPKRSEEISMTGLSKQTEQHHRSVVIFDGECNLCNGFVQFVIRNDPMAKFCIASQQSQIGQAMAFLYSEPLGKSIVVISGSQLYTKSDAVFFILSNLEVMPKLRWMRIIPRRIRDFFYDLIAGSRLKIFGT